jgi:hypothetical protein
MRAFRATRSFQGLLGKFVILEMSLIIESRGITGLDVFANGRAQGSVELGGGDNEIIVPDGKATVLELKGFNKGELVAARRVSCGQSTGTT